MSKARPDLQIEVKSEMMEHVMGYQQIMEYSNSVSVAYLFSLYFG